MAQTAFRLARLTGLLDRLCPKQRLALFLAALCHDIEHPGVSSAFLLKSRSRMAAWYKDDPGLLEKHHSIRAFELLMSKDLDLLGNMPTDDRVNVRKLVRDLILATDMGRHASIVKELEERLLAEAAEDCGQHCPAAASVHEPAQSCETEAGWPPPSLLLHMQVLLKCADISNVTKPLPVAMEWAVAVSDEFFAQGDLERARGIEVGAG